MMRNRTCAFSFFRVRHAQHTPLACTDRNTSTHTHTHTHTHSDTHSRTLARTRGYDTSMSTRGAHTGHALARHGISPASSRLLRCTGCQSAVRMIAQHKLAPVSALIWFVFFFLHVLFLIGNCVVPPLPSFYVTQTDNSPLALSLSLHFVCASFSAYTITLYSHSAVNNHVPQMRSISTKRRCQYTSC
jgi:hypothetical protein